MTPQDAAATPGAGLAGRVPTFHFDRLEYFREEKEGYITIRSSTHPETNEVVLNPTANQIIRLCDGSRSVAAVAAAMKGLYPKAPPDVIERDINTMISSLSRMRLIDWDGPDPFHNPHPADLGFGWRGRLASEDDTQAIVDFAARARKSGAFPARSPAGSPAGSPAAALAGSPAPAPAWLAFRSPLLSPGGLGELEVRQGLYARLDHYFLMTCHGADGADGAGSGAGGGASDGADGAGDGAGAAGAGNDAIEGLLSIRSPLPYGSHLAVVRLILLPRGCPAAPAFLRYAADLLPAAAPFSLTGVRLYWVRSAALDPDLAALIDGAGFAAEMTMRDEMGPEKDLIVLRYSLGGA
jgi:hypothetical protein